MQQPPPNSEHAEQDKATVKPIAPALEMRGIEKSFGRIQAIRGVNFKAGANEILGIVGDNGAGKSTLMKVLSGAVIPDAGEIRIDNELVDISGPTSAQNLGIQMIYQDLALFNNLDVTANLYFGHERTRWGLFLRKSEMHEGAAKLLQQLNVNIPDTKLDVEWMSGGQRQMIACAKAMGFASRILVLDEPTAALGVREANALLDAIVKLRDTHTILLVTQRIPDVLSIANKVLVIKDGRDQGVLNVPDVSLDDIVELIIKGRDPSSASTHPDDDGVRHRSFG